MEREKAVLLKGKFNDLSDILNIARHEGKRLFQCDRVRVDPQLFYNHKGVVVIVSREK